MNAALTDHIADLLQQASPQPDDLADVMAEAGEEQQRLERQHERARKLSLDPLARSDVVDKARDDVDGPPSPVSACRSRSKN